MWSVDPSADNSLNFFPGCIILPGVSLLAFYLVRWKLVAVFVDVDRLLLMLSACASQQIDIGIGPGLRVWVGWFYLGKAKRSHVAAVRSIDLVVLISDVVIAFKWGLISFWLIALRNLQVLRISLVLKDLVTTLFWGLVFSFWIGSFLVWRFVFANGKGDVALQLCAQSARIHL